MFNARVKLQHMALNYGEALQDLPDDKILARLKNWNANG